MRLRGQQLNKPLLAARRAEDGTLFYSPIQHVIPPSRQIDSSGASHPHILLFPAVHGKTFRVLYRRDPLSSALKPALRLMTAYRLMIEEIKDAEVITSYTRWVDAVQVKGAENQEVYLFNTQSAL